MNFDFDKNLKEDFVFFSKSNLYIFSYLSYMLKTVVVFSADNICTSQISLAYA
ncbi:hypothetical protein SAMN06265349_102715 [Flavobacterium resistens]|uniref:Uncharacterized protein n=1 Tax=Flavobacterium resistens TaxID=443612 RepID=A0A521CMG4_9FLAO|nr:hypothetical protein SAMN06265349_102715 [Flavobacterium resistens]